MSRKVWRKVARKPKEKVVLQSYPKIEDEVLDLERQEDVDWTSLSDDTVI
jgi:valyl-tRNA synthetase